MSKILVIGARPLPFEKSNSLFALGLRTWHFVKPLLDDAHQVYLFAGPIPPPKQLDKSQPKEEKTSKENLTYHAIYDIDLYFNPSYLQSIHDEFKPDCILGINTLPASVAAKITTDKPLWLDLNGALMTEGQARANLIGNNSPVTEFWEQEKICLQKGDIFSTVSLPQKYMLLGELAALKRLNQYTNSYEFAHPVPNSVEHCDYTHQKNVLRGKSVDEKDFVILWSGGYNTWTDIDFLFDSLVSVMSKYQHVKFVSTGGSIPIHNEITYQKFIEKIEKSNLKKQFIMQGWVPTEDIHDYYFESNLGISIDTFNYETLTGARNRLIHMMKIGLPVLTTLGTEISHVIQDNQIGLTCPIRNINEFQSQLEYAITHSEEIKKTGIAGKVFVQSHYTFEKTTQCLREWIKNPKNAPDKNQITPLSQKPEIKDNSPLGQAVGFYRKLIKRYI